MIYRLSLQGVKCAGCVRSLEKGLKQSDCIDDYSVNFADRSLTVSSETDVSDVISAVEAAGYGAVPLDDNDGLEQAEAAELAHYHLTIKRSLIALGFGFLLMVQGWLGFMPDLTLGTGLLQGAVIGLLTLAIMWFCAGHIYKGALQSIQRRSFNMDTLIGLGTGAAWVYSTGLIIYVLAGGQLIEEASHLYYEASVMILGFILLGQALEARARKNTGEAIRSLMNLQPATAIRLREGEEKEVPVALLAPGDQVRIRPGESVPVDGVVLTGESHVDESMLTGESLPIHKQTDDQLVGGTINGSGSLVMQVEQIGAQTVLAKIIESVRDAQNCKPELGKLADRIAAVFVPVVMLIALVTALVWWAFGPEPQLTYSVITMMTVLIIACPCALGLATPMSVMVSVGRAAKQGILIRNADALQQAEKVTTVLLDKTGTVTQGKPTVEKVEFFISEDEQEHIIQELLSVESLSQHPLARAICDSFAMKQQFEVEQFQELPGLGVVAVLQGNNWLVGNQQLMLEREVDISQFTSVADGFSQQAMTPVYLSRNGSVCALVGIADPVKEDSLIAINEMKEAGLRVILLSGDNQKTAQIIGDRVNVDRVIAEVKPEEKRQVVADLQSEGHVVAMVGDGINDAPALAQADLGYAIGTGADVAIASADVTLISGSLRGVNKAMSLSKHTVRNIRQNLFGAFI